MKKSNNIDIIFSKGKLINIGTIVVATIVSCIMILSLLGIENTYVETVRQIQLKYGKYAFSIKSAKEEDIKKILVYDNINKKYISAHKIEEAVSEEKEYKYYFCNEDILEIEGSTLIEGKYPCKDNEVLVEKRLGNNENLNVGDSLDLKFSENKFKKYVITGFFEKESAYDDVDNAAYDFYFADDEEDNCTFFTLKNYNKTYKSLKKIQKETNLEIYSSVALMSGLGYMNDGDLYKKTMSAYYYIYVLFLISGLFLIYNIIKVFINEQYENISILNLLGVDKGNISKKIFLVCIKKILLGFICGFLLAHILYCGFGIIMYHSFDILEMVFIGTDYKLYLSSMLIFAVLGIVILLPLFLKIRVLSPASLLSGENLIFKRKYCKSKRYIFRNRRLFEYKYAKNQIRNMGISKIITILGCCMATIIIVVGIYNIQINNKEAVDINSDYEIEVEPSYLYDRGEVNNYIEDINNNALLKSTSDYIFFNNVIADIRIDKVSGNYIDYIGQDIEKRMEIEYSTSGCIKQDIGVYAYSDDSLKKMLSENDIFVDKIKKDDVYILSNMNSNEMSNYSFKNSYRKNDYIEINTYEGSTESKKLNISGTIDKLDIKSGNENFNIIIIVSKELYSELFDEVVPGKIYIKDGIDSSDVGSEEALKTLEMSGRYKISYPKKEAKNRKKVNLLKSIFVYIIAIITVLMGVIIIVSNTVLKIRVNHLEYAMMKAIGVNENSIFKTFSIESIIIFIRAQVIAIVASYFITKAIFVDKYVLYGTYLYRYPLWIVILSIIVCFVIWMITLLPVKALIKNVNSNSILKRIN